MNSQQIQQQIYQKQGRIVDLQTFLKRTDYKAIREFEGGAPCDSETKQARADARTEINRLQEEILDLGVQLEEAIAAEEEPEGKEE